MLFHIHMGFGDVSFLSGLQTSAVHSEKHILVVYNNRK